MGVTGELEGHPTFRATDSGGKLLQLQFEYSEVRGGWLVGRSVGWWLMDGRWLVDGRRSGDRLIGWLIGWFMIDGRWLNDGQRVGSWLYGASIM